MRPGLEVVAAPVPVETLPMGLLAGAIAVSCLDSLAARLTLAARAWRLGRPFVDAAVTGGPSLMVRTNVYLPIDGAACFECAFDEDDYRQVERTYPCAKSGESPQTQSGMGLG
jgi:molybdopterin/thiamine biosynthesis adenylyltransferase